jgi:hypothetical protein
MKTEITTTPAGRFVVIVNGQPHPQGPQDYLIQAETLVADIAAEDRRRRANAAFWHRQDADAYAKGMRYRSGHAAGGNAYHRTRTAAEAAAQRAAKRACPANPPAWHIEPLSAQ